MRKWLSVWALSTLALSSSALAERGFVLATPVVILMPYVLPNAELLELTPTQRREAMLIANRMNSEREANDLMAKDLRKELWEITSGYRPEKNAQQELIDLIAKTEKRRIEMSVECANGLRRVLNEQQWQLLIELAADVQNQSSS
jgi:hypothetical protein